MKYDVIIIGGGCAGMAKAVELQKQGKRCIVISKGRSLYGYSPEEFQRLGGTVLMGDCVTGAEMEGKRVARIFTENLGEVSLEADTYYLASGKFFAGGLIADMKSVYEPIFGLDVDAEEDRAKWFNADFAAPQPFLDFGVKTDEAGHALKDGSVVENLFPIGEIITKRK